MPLDQGLLKGAQSREWVVAKPPTGASPQWVYTGRDESGLGPIYVALASISAPPSRETMRALHAAYKGKSNIQLVVGAVLGNQVWIFGPDEKTEVTEPLALDQGCRQLQSALDEPDAIAAYTRLGQFRRSLDTTSLVGVTNSGLFASYHIRENVPKRNDWKESCEKAKPLLALRNEHLIKALGFKSEKTAGNALLLTTGTPQSKAVAILLDETEQFDATSARHTGISPVAFGLNVAARQGVPWLFVLRKDQIRIYPAKDGVGVGQKGQVETYLEIDLAAIDSERAGLLTLIFSADALEPNGTANDLLQGSQLFASQLGSRLRERIYEHVVPQLSKSVAEHLREQGTNLDSEGLSLAYRLTLRILFRLLFQAYAEDRGLLPAGRNEGYDANSLKTIAKRIMSTPAEQFGKSKTLWFDLVQVWDAIDEGNETWNVPAYNGGLFGKDPSVYPEGALIEKLGIQDDVLGPVLQHLLLDISEDNVLGPVDFRSLSVREFGTIYEGLLESSLSVATQALTVDSKGAWIPAAKSDEILASAGEVYFHSASGERKATGSYFTPSFVVDYLIENSVDHALDSHLERIKTMIIKGDLASAASNFFDFRVVDLAMGSGHFLVAALDRIESKMRLFLAERETQIPGVNAELARLAISAKQALGRDESAIGEIEPAALLRRQIARRCIYGLDINPLAVELSRLALWIHTFVPGLPMSSLDHGLICANSLTGVGTVDEALREIDPNYDSGQFNFFESAITDTLQKAKDLLVEVANTSEANKREVKQSAQAAKVARTQALPAKYIFDGAIGVRLGLLNRDSFLDEATATEMTSAEEFQKAISLVRPAHFPYLFPEVFLRENSGFDVVLGNPPWEKAKVEVSRWWALRFPGLRSLPQGKQDKLIEEYRDAYPVLAGEIDQEVLSNREIRKSLTSGPYPGIGTGDPDLYQAFAWRNWQLLRKNGIASFIAPRSLISEAGSELWREQVINNGEFKRITLLSNNKRWVFPIHAQYSFSVIAIEKLNKPGEFITLDGPYGSLEEFQALKKIAPAKFTLEQFRSWGIGSAFPILSNSTEMEIYSLMKSHPRIDADDESLVIRVHAEFHATNDKHLYTLDVVPSGYWPLYKGESFNLWNPDTGKYYGGIDPTKIVPYLLEKRKKQRKLKGSAFAQFSDKWLNDEDTLPLMHARIAFRKVTNRTNSRSVICSLVPPRVAISEAAPYLLFPKGSAADMAYVLGVMSSIPFDWQARRSVEINLSYYVLYALTLPRPSENNSARGRIVAIVAELTCVDSRFKDWATSLGREISEQIGNEIKDELLAELDALVAHLFGLSENQLRYIYENFQRGTVLSDRLEKALGYLTEINTSG